MAVVALPWLSVKYAPGGGRCSRRSGVWRLWRDGPPARGRPGWRPGSRSRRWPSWWCTRRSTAARRPYAAGSYFVDGQLQVIGSDPDYVGRSRRLVGLFVDRDFGIAAWQPAWLRADPRPGRAGGPPAAGRVDPGRCPLAAGWFVATFVALTMQGWWFPGRQLVVVLPLAAIAIAWWARSGGWRLATFLALGAVGVLAQAWIVAEGLRGDLAWVVNLQSTANPLYRAWREALPSYLARGRRRPGSLHWGWAAVAVAVAVARLPRRPASPLPRRRRRDDTWRPPCEPDGMSRPVAWAALGAAGAAALYALVLRPRHMTWGATGDEARGPVAGDELLPDADIVSTRVVEIDAPPWAVWPWLVQMGPGRGGAYTYDWIERRLGVDIRNVDRVVPELQDLRVGDEIPMPGYAMRVERLDPERAMVVRSTTGGWVWAFELRPADGRTRLVSRNRIDRLAGGRRATGSATRSWSPAPG